MTRSQIAKMLGVEIGTVKTHLLRVFAKTGTRRQADLVRLGASLALPLQ
jgi:DNA-binding CsgD family transcriptional regulator